MVSQAADISGVKVLAALLEGADAAVLRETLDKLKDKLGPAAIVLAAVDGDQISLIAGVTPDLVAKIKAGETGEHGRTTGWRKRRGEARHGNGRRHATRTFGCGTGFRFKLGEGKVMSMESPALLTAPAAEGWLRSSREPAGVLLAGAPERLRRHRVAVAPDMAMASGTQPENLANVLASVSGLVKYRT